MAKQRLLIYGMMSCLSFLGVSSKPAAQDSTHLRVNVVLVELNVAVTDSKGNYVTGLKPSDFEVTEDKIPQKVSTFEESNQLQSGDEVSRPGESKAKRTADEGGATMLSAGDVAGVAMSHLNPSSVYVLFDTSNYMYRSFVFAQDAIADFIRSMDSASKIAFYSYCRDLSRSVQLSPDHYQVINGVRSSVAGDDAALYNSLLLTV